MKLIFRKSLVTLTASMMMLLMFVVPVQAAEGFAEKKGLLSGVTLQCLTVGSCTACDILVVFINVANVILAVLGGLATVFFLYGAGTLMLSGGNQQSIEKGKTIIKSVIVGTLIVLASWQVMSVVTSLIVNQTTETKDREVNPIFGWYEIAKTCKTPKAPKPLK